MMPAQLTESGTSSLHAVRPFSISHGTRPPLAGSSSFAAQPPRPFTEQPRSRAEKSSQILELPQRKPPVPTRPRSRPATDETAANATFNRMYSHLMQEEAEFVGELDTLLKSIELQKFRKSKALYNTWECDVFERAQEEISAAVNARTQRSVSERNAARMEEFIHVSNSKPHGVFRDIVIESEYDPLAAHSECLRYDNRVRHDPCKLELRKQTQKAADAARRAEFLKPDTGGLVPRLSPLVWDKLESTPYGRLGKVVPRPDAPAYRLTNRVTFDEYQMVRGREVLERELPLGKRCFPGKR